MHQDNRHQNSGMPAENRSKLNCPDTFPDTYADRSPGHNMYQRTTVSGVGTVERGRPNTKGNGHYCIWCFIGQAHLIGIN